MAKEVNIKVTPDGWEVEVVLGDKTFREVHASTRMGSRWIQGDDFELEHDIGEQLFEALNSHKFYEIMRGLDNNREF